jgi:hypothetical protein
MRTTLEIDTDVLQAAKDLAVLEKTTTGRIISRMARHGLCSESQMSQAHAMERNGIEMLPRRNELITLNHVQSILDEEGI